MLAFQDIADANPGLDGHPSRNSGEPGYLASALYVKDKMEAAGYDVALQRYKFTYTSFVGTPTWSANGQRLRPGHRLESRHEQWGRQRRNPAIRRNRHAAKPQRLHLDSRLHVS